MATHVKAHQKGKNRKEVRNARLEIDAMNDSEALFGRIMKQLGGGNFLLSVQDPDHRERLLEEQHAHIAGAATARITVNDVVVCAESGRGGKSGKRQFEIIGIMSKKNISVLLQQKRIHPALIVERNDGKGEDEGGIFFDDTEEEGEEGGAGGENRTKAAKTAAAAAAAAPSRAERALGLDDELDIDEI
jgi:hypothetical protein